MIRPALLLLPWLTLALPDVAQAEMQFTCAAREPGRITCEIAPAAGLVLVQDSIPMRGVQNSVPVPDPTVLTVSLLNREVELLRQQMLQLNAATKESLETRLDSLQAVSELQSQKVDNAITARNTLIEAVREEAIQRVASLEALITERFNRVDAGFTNVDNQFINRDTAVNAALTATQTAANNALTATKEAVATAGIVTEKQITQQGNLLNEVTNGLRIAVDDLKTSVSEVTARAPSTGELASLGQRLTAIEARTLGGTESRSALNENLGLIIGALGALIAAMVFISKGRQPEQPQVRYVQSMPQQPQGVTTTTNTTPG